MTFVVCDISWGATSCNGMREKRCTWHECQPFPGVLICNEWLTEMHSNWCSFLCISQISSHISSELCKYTTDLLTELEEAHFKMDASLIQNVITGDMNKQMSSEIIDSQWFNALNNEAWPLIWGIQYGFSASFSDNMCLIKWQRLSMLRYNGDKMKAQEGMESSQKQTSVGSALYGVPMELKQLKLALLWTTSVLMKGSSRRGQRLFLYYHPLAELSSVLVQRGLEFSLLNVDKPCL